MILSSALLLLLFVLSSCAAPADDEVQSLPGWAGALPSRHYSGYLRVAGGTNLHYYFVSSERSPQTAPTVVWLNGGPGCSSLDGWTCPTPRPPEPPEQQSWTIYIPLFVLLAATQHRALLSECFLQV